MQESNTHTQPGVESTVLLDHALVEKVFTAWETRLRDDPTGFLTPDEVAAMEVATISEARAIYFMGLLREVAA